MPANRIIFSKLIEIPDLLKGDKVDERGLTVIIHAGYVNACMAEDKQETKSFEFFYSFVEDNADDSTILKEIADCFANSKQTAKMVDKVNAATEDVKKKSLTGMKLSPSVMVNLASDQGNTID